MFLVLVVHANFWSLEQPTIDDFTDSPLNAWCRTFFQSSAIGCVNVFILISGWFGIKPSVKGFCNFLFQTGFFQFGIYGTMVLTGLASLSLKGIAECLCFSSVSWFIISYACLYVLSPMLNAFLKSASQRQLLGTLIGFYTIQTIWGWKGTAPFFFEGYSTTSFIGLYMLARYVKLYAFQLLKKFGGIIYIASIVINSILFYAQIKLNIQIPIYAYLNPFVIAGALGLLIIFARLEVPTNTLINWIASSAFAVFLVHTNPNISYDYFIPFICHIYESYNGILCLLTILLTLICIFLTSIIFDQPRKYLWKFLAGKSLGIQLTTKSSRR